MEKGRKQKAVIISILLACALLVTELPRVLEAAEVYLTSEQQDETRVTGIDESNTISSKQSEASQIAPIAKTDPMYWMGQRSGGDTNRAMVWFGEYWQDAAASKKAPILWRTLRSDGEGNYGGAVTLLTEYALNAVYYDAVTPFNHHWFNSATGSSDLRAYLNGVGTGAMDSAADSGSRQGTTIPYNNGESNGGAGSIKGSFYANAFNNDEKNLIIPTEIKKEAGVGSGKDVSDKIFALTGCHSCPANYDSVSSVYFSGNPDRQCHPTSFSLVASNTTTGVASFNSGGFTYWWMRSPFTSYQYSAGLVYLDGSVDSTNVNDPKFSARPALNLDPSTVLFTSASATGSEPLDTWSGNPVIGLEASSGTAADACETDINDEPTYGQGATYRVFARSNENSGLGIANGKTKGSIAVSYPSNASGQYISAMAVTSAGEKWIGRIKQISDNNSGTVEFFLPQHTPGTSVERDVRVFAWRETEETKTACIPNYQDLIINEADSYKITYDNNGGTNGSSSMAAHSVVQGSAFTIHACTFKKAGNYFVGWQGSDGVMYADQEVITPTGDLTLTAIWSNSYKSITYKAGKGSGSDIVFHAGTGSRVTLRTSSFTPPESAGFMEWNTEADGSGTSYQPGDSVVLNDHLNLFAVYGTKASITYDGNGAAEANTTQAGFLEKKFELKSDGFTRQGYRLTGWNTAADGSGVGYGLGEKVTLTGDCTLYAQWDANVWTIKFNISSADQGTTIEDITADLNDKVKLPDGSGLKKAHYTFDGWNTASDGTSGTSYQGGADLTIQESLPKTLLLYAKWKSADTYKLSYDKNGSEVSGTVPSTVTCYNDKINHTTDIPRNSLTRTGYTFAGWSETKNGSVKYYPGDTINMAEKGKDLTLFAVWTLNSFQLIYDANAADITGNVPAAVTANADSNIKAAAQGSMYRPEYKFYGWNTEADGSGAAIQPGAEIILDANKVLYAVWKPLTAVHITYRSGCDDLTVDPTLPIDSKNYFDDGIHTPGTISAQKPIRYGYEFSYWATQENGGGTQYNGGEDIKVTKDLTLYAIWDMGNYTLSYNANAKEVQGKMPADKYGTVLSNIKAEDNTGFTRPYYTFKGWNTEANGTGMTYQPGDLISLGRDITLYAQWRETVYKISFDLNSPVISQAQGTIPDDIQGTHLEKFTAPNPLDFYCPKYMFTGWNTDPDGGGQQFIPEEEYAYEVFENYGEEVTLYANWVSVPPYEVVYHKNASDASGEVPVDSNLYTPNDGSNLATVLGPGKLTRKGYEFVCWTTKKDGSGSRYVEGSRFRVTAHTVLYAQWTPGTYSLIYDKNGSSVTGKAPASVKISSQEDIKAAGQNTMKRKNYEFLGWSTNKSAAAATYKEGVKFRILENTTLYAVWKKLINVIIEHTEGLKPSSNTNVNVSQGTKLGDLKLPEVKEGYEIEGWIVNGEKVTNPKAYVLSKDSEVQAIVKKKPTDSGKKDPAVDNSRKDDTDNKNGSNEGENGSNPNNSQGDKDSQSSGNSSSNGSKKTSTRAKGVSSDVTLGTSKPDKKEQNAPAKISSNSDINEGKGTADAANKVVSNKNIRTGAGITGLPWSKAAECRIHFLILIGMLIWLMLTIYWYVHTRKKEEEDSGQTEENVNKKPSLIFDSILPMIPFGCGLVFYLLRTCPWDMMLLTIWLLAAAVNLFMVKRSYTKRFI